METQQIGQGWKRVFTLCSVSPVAKRQFNPLYFFVVKAMSSLFLGAESGGSKWDLGWSNELENQQCTGDNWSNRIQDDPEKCHLEREQK